MALFRKVAGGNAREWSGLSERAARSGGRAVARRAARQEVAPAWTSMAAVSNLSAYVGLPGCAVRVFWDPVQLRHKPRLFLQHGVACANLEVPDRALSLLEGVQALGLCTELPPEMPTAMLRTVHSAACAFLPQCR